jgi:hypothetical protein
MFTELSTGIYTIIILRRHALVNINNHFLGLLMEQLLTALLYMLSTNLSFKKRIHLHVCCTTIKISKMKKC